MKEIKNDLFECALDPEVDAICITTNGHYTSDGLAIMGGGCAGVCAKKWAQTPKNLGRFLKQTKRNIPFIIGALNSQGEYIEPTNSIIKNKKYKCLIYSYPTIDNLMDGANLQLITQSAVMLVEHANKHGLKKVILPRPGVGIGSLRWSEVKPALENILDDRFIIVSFKHEE